MHITKNGLIFCDYQGASPGIDFSSFTDKDGATLLIDAATLVRMYELCKFDLERRHGWAAVMAKIETPNA